MGYNLTIGRSYLLIQMPKVFHVEQFVEQFSDESSTRNG